MSDNNNTFSTGSENKIETPAADPVIPAGQPSPFQPVPQAVTPATPYQQPVVQQNYYARPVPNGYGAYVQHAQPVRPMQPAVPAPQVRQYQPVTAGAPVSQFQQAPQPAPASQKPASAPAPVQAGNGGKRSIVFPVICSIALAVLFLYSVGQTVYISRLNKKIADRPVQSSETTSWETDESEPGESGESGETTKPEEPTETNEKGEPWFDIEKAAGANDPNKKALKTTEIVELASPATIPVYIMKGSGSTAKKAASGTGFIITKDGYIVTNAHVVKYVTQSPSQYSVSVLLPDETDLVEAEIVGSDTTIDIAVLKVKVNRELPSLKFGDSDKLKSGELVIAIGNAMGQLDDTVTVGVVSATNRDISASGYMIKVIQTDAAINNGNSGGPLLNSFGEVVGITNAKINSSISEGLGFAIPVNSVKSDIESIINHGKVTGRPYLGISVKKFAEGEYKEGAEAGVYCMELTRGGPAEKAGIKVGDRLISLGGVEIKNSNDLSGVRDSHKVGDSITVVVERNGSTHTLTLVVGDSGDFQTQATPTPTQRPRRTQRDEDDE